MTEKKFPQGIRWSNPPEKAPDFIRGKISIKVDEFIQWLEENQTNNWVNLVVKKSQKGSIYLDLDTWKPTRPTSEQAREEIEEEINVNGIPF